MDNQMGSKYWEELDADGRVTLEFTWIEVAQDKAGCHTLANDTAVKVHAIIRRTRDVSLQNKLKQFSLQLLHGKIQFTACGFFPLDYTLIHSIVAASTTYLIILIQFQLSSRTTKEDVRDLDVINCINYLNKTNSSY